MTTPRRSVASVTSRRCSTLTLGSQFWVARLIARFQIPNTPGLTPNFTAFGVSTFNSALLNENQLEQNYYRVAALQRSINGADVQLSYFTRYSSVHFTPDTVGDLVLNGVASDVFRSNFAN